MPMKQCVGNPTPVHSVGGWSWASCITGMVWLVFWIDPSETGTRFLLDKWGLNAAKILTLTALMINSLSLVRCSFPCINKYAEGWAMRPLLAAARLPLACQAALSLEGQSDEPSD